MSFYGPLLILDLSSVFSSLISLCFQRLLVIHKHKANKLYHFWIIDAICKTGHLECFFKIKYSHQNYRRGEYGNCTFVIYVTSSTHTQIRIHMNSQCYIHTMQKNINICDDNLIRIFKSRYFLISELCFQWFLQLIFRYCCF